MESEWRIEQSPDPIAVKKLEQTIARIHPIVAKLLVQRKILDYESAEEFLNPSEKQLYDPFLMADLDIAVDIIHDAVRNGERIMVFGDYDVDGTTSVALVYSFLKRYTNRCEYYIPDRYKEGYGISFEGIDRAVELGCSVMIALDCGIKALDKAKYAADKGLKLIICDHHTPGEELPTASAVLDPKRADCQYPYKELCGCGVGFKLVQGLATRYSQYDFGLVMELADLVAVAIASDIVPITGENRVLASLGLKKLNRQPRPGIKALIDSANGKKGSKKVSRQKLGMDDIVFRIGPRINAAGRMHSGKQAVHLMVSDNAAEAMEVCAEIEQHNKQRREVDQQTTIEALGMVETDSSMQESRTSVVVNENWHKGVIGIVASRLIEKYYRPTVVFTESNGQYTGSARSVHGFDLYEAIHACSDHIVQFGGHKHAAGLTIEKDQFDSFKSRFEEVVSEALGERELRPLVEIDLEAELDSLVSKNDLRELEHSGIAPQLVRQMERLAPFGPGNMRPVFYSRNCRALDVRLLKEEHLKFKVCQGYHENAVRLDAIGFRMAEFYPALLHGKHFTLAYTININEFNGKCNLQLQVKDIRLED